jgi:putative CocE/NonD family hydrolase
MRPLSYLCCALAVTAIGFGQSRGAPQYPNYPTEIPAKVQPSTSSFDYERRDVMIPMRDGVKLHAVVLVPRGAKNAPMLLTRTPYNASELTSHASSPHLAPVLQGYDNAVDVIVEGGYIRVVEDVRGKYGSEGDYVMNRPLSGPQNPTPVDHSTDTYDTIDWLVKNVAESNGKVGILGISYDGFTPLMALVNPHPALKDSEQEGSRDNQEKWWNGHYDDFDFYMEAGSAGDLGQKHGMEQMGFWRKILAHPSYDAFWRDQAMDKILAGQPLKVPVLLVSSVWDQEDIYGALAVYRAIKPKDTGNDKVFLVMGPWFHGQEIGDGSSLGALKFHSDTALYFRQNVLRPFLDHYLKDGGGEAGVAPVTAYETGTNKWLKMASWPAGCESGCSIKPAPFYLEAGGKASFAPPASGDNTYQEYVSDPARPVPYRSRPVTASSKSWQEWLVSDQREASGRPDVAVFTSETLREPVKISGQPIVNLVASTSGTDSDWVVKVIDLYPDQVAGDEAMGGYQLMVSADIFRGRYRESLETPKAIEPDKPLVYKFALPTANHVFLPGHKMMVQVQSSWFPLYDRNPQTFVPNIFWAKPADYKKATQRIYSSGANASFIELPVVVR